MWPPSPEKPRSGQMRTSPPRLTTTCLRTPRLQTLTRWLEAWTASSCQPWTVTRVSSAPSATVTSTPWVRAAVPVWSRTTVPLEPASAATRMCWAVGRASCVSWPMMFSRAARSSWAPGSRVSTVAVSVPFQAVTPVRSTGAPTVPMRASLRATVSRLAPSGRSASTRIPASLWPSVAAWMASRSNSGAKRFIGVKRHSSSRPRGTGMSAGSKEVGRSAREET